jgi:hypothetical protein
LPADRAFEAQIVVVGVFEVELVHAVEGGLGRGKVEAFGLEFDVEDIGVVADELGDHALATGL